MTVKYFKELDNVVFSPPLAVEIDYLASNGKTTTRKIDINRVFRSESNYCSYSLQSFCHLRNKRRTFILDSVKSARIDGFEVDLEIYIRETYNKRHNIIPDKKDSILVDKNSKTFSKRMGF